MDWYFEALKKYAVFTGRARRAEYWNFCLFNFLASLLMIALDWWEGTRVFVLLYSIAVFCPSLALCVRRLHDTGRSGWWNAIVIVPIAGLIVLTVFALMRGDSGTNKYGQDPKTVPLTRVKDLNRIPREEAAAAVARDADRRRHEKDLESIRPKVCRVWRGHHPNEGPVELLFEADGLVVFNFRGGQVAKSGHYEILASPKGYLLRFIIPKEDIEEEVGLRLLSNGQLMLDFGQFELLLTPV